jgi:hypothetical protein
VNRAEEHTLVWALVDAARSFLRGDAHNELCTRIGAGEFEDAIRAALHHYLVADRELPYALAVDLNRWCDGYAGSGREEALRRTIDQIRVSPPPPRVVPDAQPGRRTPIRLLVKQRFARARR